MLQKLGEHYIKTAAKLEFPNTLMGTGIGAVSGALWAIKEPEPSFVRTTAYTIIATAAGGSFGFVSAYMFPVFAISVPAYAYHEYKSSGG